MLAHDIRNPVGLILGCATLLLDESAAPDADLAASLNRRILDHARVLQSLVNNYLDVSTIEAGQLALRRTPVDLPELLAQLAHRYELEARRRSIDLILDCSDCPGLEGDALAIGRIVGNLLQNAFKFTSDGGRIALGCAPRAGHAVVSVADNGPGIDLKQVPCLFKKFKRVEIVERQEGLGLGLYIVKELAEAHGGRVEVASEPGTGTSFSIYLPLRAAGAQGG
jgi:signal transduction histidine kinase